MIRRFRYAAGAHLHPDQPGARMLQRELAERLGVTEATVRRYEQEGAPYWMRLAMRALSYEIGLDPATWERDEPDRSITHDRADS
jgi:transcriptional regulator with XRE-family HTH domain